MRGRSALGTVLGLVHSGQLALQADVADAVLLGDWLGHRGEEQPERCLWDHGHSFPCPIHPQAMRAQILTP